MNDDTYPPSATDAWLHERCRLTLPLPTCTHEAWQADSTFRPEAHQHLVPLPAWMHSSTSPDARHPPSTLERQCAACLMPPFGPPDCLAGCDVPGGDSAETLGDLPFLISFFPSWSSHSLLCFFLNGNPCSVLAVWISVFPCGKGRGLGKQRIQTEALSGGELCWFFLLLSVGWVVEAVK